MHRPSAPLRFLVVEDEAILAMDLGLMIEEAGHEVVGEVACLREAESLPDDTEPHIAFVDVQLAEGSTGFEVSAYIQRHWARAIIVFVTANPKKIPVDFAGAHGVIAKPFSRNSIMSAMCYLVEGVCEPPPSSPQPTSFVASPALAAAWAGRPDARPAAS